MQDQSALGWRIGTFVEDTYLPHPTLERTSSQIWNDYRQWCTREAVAPLSLLEFNQLLAELMQELGVPSRQIGGNVIYVGLERR
jgi:hypothetical protein